MIDWPEIQGAAERRFLGQHPVVGIAVAERPSRQLVFFLSQDSPAAVAQISQWAKQNGVDFDLKVTGSFQRLK